MRPHVTPQGSATGEALVAQFTHMLRFLIFFHRIELQLNSENSDQESNVQKGLIDLVTQTEQKC